MLSISTLDENPELIGAATRQGLAFEYSGFVDPGNHRADRIARFRASELRPRTASLHGPFLDLIPGSADREVRAVARKRILAGLGVCEELGVGRIVFHSGWFPKTYGDEAWIRASAPFWKDVAGRRERGTSILIENVYEGDPALLADLIDAIGCDGVKACLDIGHVNANSRVGVGDWIRRLGSRIGHVHIHNNHGSEDEHNGIGEGSLDIPAVCELLDRHCPDAAWNLEIKGDYEGSIATMLGCERQRRRA